jgi:hypothetical protein
MRSKLLVAMVVLIALSMATGLASAMFSVSHKVDVTFGKPLDVFGLSELDAWSGDTCLLPLTVRNNKSEPVTVRWRVTWEPENVMVGAYFQGNQTVTIPALSESVFDWVVFSNQPEVYKGQADFQCYTVE